VNAEQLANAILDGEDPKAFLKQKSSEYQQRREMAQTFIDAYIDAALWSSSDDEGPLDRFDADDIDIATKGQMVDDCISFYFDNYDMISDDPEQAGHDFWLTRNHHGAGFWDGDWENGDELTKAAHAYGSYDLWVGIDDKIHGA